MYAVVEIAGKQFRVEKDKNIKVPLLKANSGSTVEFDQVLAYTDDQGATQIGKPMLADMKVTATVVEHGRDKKVIVFKKKRRKGYQKKNGHRQGFSLIKIDDIAVVKAKPAKKAQPKTETVEKPKAEVKTTKAPAAKKAAPKKEFAPKKKAAPKKETAPKKATVIKEAKPKAESKAKTATKAAPKKPAAKKDTKEA